jgi:hypothetical protein
VPVAVTSGLGFASSVRFLGTFNYLVSVPTRAYFALVAPSRSRTASIKYVQAERENYRKC